MEGNLASGNGVVIFTNGADGARLYPEIRRAVAVTEGWPDTGVVEVPALSSSAANMSEVQGAYRIQALAGAIGERMRMSLPYPLIHVSIVDGTLRIGGRAGGGEALVPADRSNFVYANDADRWVEFVAGDNGRIERLILRNDLAAVEAVREP
jgi:hypothetical protein